MCVLLSLLLPLLLLPLVPLLLHITSALAASFLNTIAMANAGLDTPGRRRVFCVDVERAKAHALDHWVVGDRPNQWSLPFAELSR